MGKSLIAVPIGDPAGVGPEIVAKSVASKEVFDAADCIIVGDKTVMENAIRITDTKLTVHVIDGPEEGDFREGVLNLIDLGNVDMENFEFGRVNGMCGKAAYEYIAKCIELANSGKVDAVASTPACGRNQLYRTYGDIRSAYGYGGSAYHVRDKRYEGIFPDAARVLERDA